MVPLRYGDRIESDEQWMLSENVTCVMKGMRRERNERGREKPSTEKKLTHNNIDEHMLQIMDRNFMCQYAHWQTARQPTGQIQFRFLIFSAIFGVCQLP